MIQLCVESRLESEISTKASLLKQEMASDLEAERDLQLQKLKDAKLEVEGSVSEFVWSSRSSFKCSFQLCRHLNKLEFKMTRS